MPESRPAPRTLEDRWILSRLARAKDATASRDRGLRVPPRGARDLRLRLRRPVRLVPGAVKPRLYGEGEPVGDVALHVLAETLAMAHPLIPFVTEEIWSYLGRAGSDRGLLRRRALARSRRCRRWTRQAEADVGAAIDAIKRIRGWRDELGVRPGATHPGAPERLRRDARPHRPPGAARVAGGRRGAGGVVHLSTWRVRGAAVRRRRSRGGGPPGRRAARDRRGGDQARRGQARQRALRARAPEAVVQAERDKLAALRAELGELEAA